MHQLLKKTLILTLTLVASLQLASCGSGGPDVPFTFGNSTNGSGSENPPPAGCQANSNCSTGQICNTSTGQCVVDPSTNVGCTSNANCSTGQICNVTTGQCQAQSTPQCTSNANCQNGLVCNTTTGACELPSSGACEVDFDASLVLKIDDSFDVGGNHFDSPSACSEYACPGNQPATTSGQNNCSNPFIGDNAFQQDPSENSDLFCCSQDNESFSVPSPPAFQSPLGSVQPRLFCDAESRHGGAREFAVTRWPGVGGTHNGKIRLKFLITENNGVQTCQVAVKPSDFPQYFLENTVLDASILIDLGKDYRTLPGVTTRDLNVPEVVASCTTTIDSASGNVRVEIPSLELRFLTQLFTNSVKCNQVDDRLSCPAPFTERFFSDPIFVPNSFQIIPGFNNAPLQLTTQQSLKSPIVTANGAQQQAALSIQGSPLQFDGTASRMKLGVAFSMPSRDDFGSSRDDDTGAGQLLAELGDGLMTAELSGTVTKLDGQPVRTLADLTTACASGGNGGGGNVALSIISNFGTQETLVVTNASGQLSAEACVPGSHVNGSCNFGEAANLPFAKDPSVTVVPGTEARFSKQGTLTLQNTSTTTSISLQMASTAGAFTVLNPLNGVSLAPGNSTNLDIRFDPQTNAQGCTTTNGVVDCQAALSISTNVVVQLKGRAKLPVSEMKVEEITTTATSAVNDTITPNDTISFGEALLGISTQTKLYRISNAGVAPLKVDNLLVAQSGAPNFRLGSVYQAASFQPASGRQWVVGQQPWTIPPSGTSTSKDLFFFLNFGPFGKCPNAASTCERSAQLTVQAPGVGNINATLTGTAKDDSRATLALYIQDESRFNAVSTHGTAPDELTGPQGEHLFLVKNNTFANNFFSFRQDDTTRALYIKNSGSSGVDLLVVKSIQENDPLNKFDLLLDPVVETVFAGCVADPLACLEIPAGSANSLVKLGTIKFNAISSGTTYSVSENQLTVTALSKQGQNSVAPIVEKGAPASASGQVVYSLQGSNGAPSGEFDLRLNRLIAGFSARINGGFQKALLVSTSTKGILERFNQQNPTKTVNADTFKEVFNLRKEDGQGLVLNAVNGTATLRRIVTTVDKKTTGASSDPVVNGMNDPLSTQDPAFKGLRIFNAPGSKINGASKVGEYFAECKKFATSTPECAFFYLYLGDFFGSTQPVPSCGNKVPVVANYKQGNANTLFANVLKPDLPADFACMEGPDGMKDESGGFFDPVTGELSFSDVAVRLFAARNPALNGPDVDATLRLSLTTGCVTPDKVPDPAARVQTLVPAPVLSDAGCAGSPGGICHNTNLMPDVPGFGSPLSPFVGPTLGSQCAPQELHGRPMAPPVGSGSVDGTPDTTGTLDNGADSDNLGFTFDLAGIGQNVTNNTAVGDANMYIIIKAEVGDF